MSRCDRDGARRVIRPVGRSRADLLAAIADDEARTEREQPFEPAKKPLDKWPCLGYNSR